MLKITDSVLALATLLTSGLFITCAPEPDRPGLSESIGGDVTESRASARPDDNPFTSPLLIEADAVTHCTHLSMTIENIHVGDRLRGELSITNSCKVSVAVLVGPVEARFRYESNTKLLNESMSRAAYSVLYIYSESVGLPADAFRGDGSEPVRAEPDYIVVLPEQKQALRIMTDIAIDEGNYGAAVICPVVATAKREGTAAAFDVSKTAERYGSSSATPVRLRPGVSRLSAADSFEVYK